MWETGKREPNFAITMRIADFFSTSTDYLLDYSSSPPQQTLPPIEISSVEDALLYTYRVASLDDREIIDNIIRLPNRQITQRKVIQFSEIEKTKRKK